MNPERLRELLAREEGETLEFKESIDLGTKAGKGKFLKELLSLANCRTSTVTYMMIGIEDKTKKPIGVTNVTEEQIQQIVSSHCRPQLRVEVYRMEVEGIVLQIYRRHNFYVLNSPIGAENNKVISNKAVFVRRGSVIDEATPDEILEMSLADAPDIAAITAALESIDGNTADIAYQVRHLSRQQGYPEYEHSKTLEMILIGMLSGGVLVYFWPNLGYEFSGVAFPLVLFLIALTSAIGWTHFGVFRALGATLLLAPLLGVLFLRLQESLFLGMSLDGSTALRYGFGVMAGATAGLLSS